MSKNKNKPLSILFSYLMISVGAVLVSVALEVFLVPNLIIDGGVTGVSIMLSQITGQRLSIFTLLLNIPFLVVGFKQLGKRFLFKACYAMLIFSVMLFVLKGVREITGDMLLATVFGGLTLGIGGGLVIRYGGCLDGTEVVAILISKNTSFSVGQVILIINIAIYTVAGFLFGWDRALYSLLTYFITFKVIDEVSEGLEQVKACTIITKNYEELAEEIYKRIGRTVTLSDSRGLVGGENVMLYIVVTRMEVSELRQIVEDIDDSVFGTVVDVSEVFGKHVKKVEKKVVAELSN